MIHFVVPAAYRDRLEEIATLRIGADYPFWLGGRINWAAQSYLVLREYREGMTLGVEPTAGRINFAHSMVWRSLGARRGEFRIGVRADYPRLFDVDVEIVQNPVQALGPRQLYLPYWPVPGLLPRNPERCGVATVAYAGRLGPKNLSTATEAAITGRFPDIEFRTIPPDRWHDMREIDALLAVRSFDRDTHDNKPASKLWNAWKAGIPLVAGWDSAFSRSGVPSADYLRVETLDELGDALERLRTDAAFYDRIVAAGAARAPEVSHASIAQQWLAEIDRVAIPLFEAGGHGVVARTTWRGADIGRNLISGLKQRVTIRGGAR